MHIEDILDGDEQSRHHRQKMAGGLVVGVSVAAVVLGWLLLVGTSLVLVALESVGNGSTGVGAGLLARIVAAELGYGIVGLVYLVHLGDGVPLSRPTGRGVLAAVVGGVVLVGVGGSVLRLVSGAAIDDVNSAITQGGVDPAVFLALAVVGVVLIGPAEELLFRGAIQGTLRRAFGPGVAVGGASLLFSAFHVNQLGANSPAAGLAALGVVFVASLAFGYAFEYTGSLAVPILMHSFYDGLLLVAGYLLTANAVAVG